MRRVRRTALGLVLLAALAAPAGLRAQEEPAATATTATTATTAPTPPATTAVAPPAAAEAPDPTAIEGDPAPRRRRPEPVARASASRRVTIEDFVYRPATVTVDVGDTVTWTNRDDAPHTATDEGRFDTGELARGESGSHTFRRAGRFAYLCTLHPQMEGTVVVRAAGAGGEAGSEAGEGGDDSGTTAGDGGSGSAAGTGDDTAASGDSDADSGSRLPATGLDALALAAIGLALVLAGVRLRRALRAGS